MVTIKNVNIITTYSWEDLKMLKNWGTVNSHKDWFQHRNTTFTGNPITIEVEVFEPSWEALKNLTSTWNAVLSTYANWQQIKDLN